jgi:hypothetical protein
MWRPQRKSIVHTEREITETCLFAQIAIALLRGQRKRFLPLLCDGLDLNVEKSRLRKLRHRHILAAIE